MNKKVQLADTGEALERIFRLRYEILRAPWGQSYESSHDELDGAAWNAYIDSSEGAVACGRLQDNGGGVGQIRYMAVREDQQGKGLAKAVLAFLENIARKSGMHTIELQARENAVSFYLSQGYEKREKSHNLWGMIQHYRMVKILP
jgi:GNAT superfamily N-acetyltransferase